MEEIHNPYPNWFSTAAVKNFAVVMLREYAGKPDLRFLQIGAYTGDASRWMLDHVLGKDGVLVDVDTWEGSDEPQHDEMDFALVEKIYNQRIRDKYVNVSKMKMTSTAYLAAKVWQNINGVEERQLFDFIYIDGAHTSAQVAEDATLAWHLLKTGGILAFDDYLWRTSTTKSDFETPRPAIDFFINSRGESLERLSIPEDYQVWVRKISVQ